MYEIIVTIIAVIGIMSFLMLLIKSGYFSKFLVRFGILESKSKTNWTAFSWESCLIKENLKADIVFFGDSIVRGGEFQKRFENVKIVNLGCSGDTLSGMISRVSTVKALNPKKIFVMGGINGLTDYNINKSLVTYKKLIDEIKNNLPNASIYIHSLLPISKNKEKQICKNKTIINLNNELRKYSENKDIQYIDLYDLYSKNGKINPELTVDGIHLKQEAYCIWMNEIEKYIYN